MPPFFSPIQSSGWLGDYGLNADNGKGIRPIGTGGYDEAAPELTRGDKGTGNGFE